MQAKHLSAIRDELANHPSFPLYSSILEPNKQIDEFSSTTDRPELVKKAVAEINRINKQCKKVDSSEANNNLASLSTQLVRDVT